MPSESKISRDKIKKQHRRNKLDEAVSLMNRYHSLQLQKLSEEESTFLKNHVIREFKKMKGDLPRWFNVSVSYWIEDRDAWINR